MTLSPSCLPAELVELLGSYRPALAAFHAESDRGAILVASSQLDVCLEELLASIMVTDGTAAREASERLLKGGVRNTLLILNIENISGLDPLSFFPIFMDWRKPLA